MGLYNHMSSGIRRGLRKLGYDIHRFDPSASPTGQLAFLLRKFEIDLIFDIGANHGQFASGIRKAGYEGKMISFEPLSDAHSELLKASGGDPNWEVFSRCALGDRDGEIEINIAGNSESSSILPMLGTHLSAAPQSGYVAREISPIKKLDTVAQKFLNETQAPFIKIDTQGFEWQVLDGAKDTIPLVRGVMVELSLVPLYEGQRLWQEMIGRLEKDRFNLWALQPGFIDRGNGRVLQMDGIFFRQP